MFNLTNTFPLNLLHFRKELSSTTTYASIAHVLYDIEAQVPAFYTVTQHQSMILQQHLQFPMNHTVTTFSIGLMILSRNL